jgi:3-methyladenine DNA glycosylase/8-oxoguanine DNA glycosylase
MTSVTDRVPEIISILRRTYPRSRTALSFENPLQILIATILSAQCTDKKVNEITPRLFKKYPSARAFAEARPEELEAEIRILKRLEELARIVRNSGQDRKWEELSRLLQDEDRAVRAEALARRMDLHVLPAIDTGAGGPEKVTAVHGRASRNQSRQQRMTLRPHIIVS